METTLTGLVMAFLVFLFGMGIMTAVVRRDTPRDAPPTGSWKAAVTFGFLAIAGVIYLGVT